MDNRFPQDQQHSHRFKEALRTSLGSPFFVLPLCLMLLNDLVLKQTFANAFTGILSDFLFLWVTPVFFSWLFRSNRPWVVLIPVLFFCWWNSILSEPFFEWMDGHRFFMNRVIDPYDYFALITIPFVYHALQTERFDASRRFNPFIAVLSLVAFLAEQPPSVSRNILIDITAIASEISGMSGSFIVTCVAVDNETVTPSGGVAFDFTETSADAIILTISERDHNELGFNMTCEAYIESDTCTSQIDLILDDHLIDFESLPHPSEDEVIPDQKLSVIGIEGTICGPSSDAGM